MLISDEADVFPSSACSVMSTSENSPVSSRAAAYSEINASVAAVPSISILEPSSIEVRVTPTGAASSIASSTSDQVTVPWERAV